MSTLPADHSETLPTSAETEDGAPVFRVDTQTLALAQVRDPARYVILGEHGRGGLGRVSRAHDRELGRDVAIKELISRGEAGEVRFLREALITARLEHPGIVAVHEAGRWPDGTPFYAMKLVAGRSLRELIAERPTADERIGLLHHVIAVADAIAYAHGRHIVHRDLKPANVIVGDFGETVVIDWGLAKDLTGAEDAAIGSGPVRVHRDSELTGAGIVVGTPAYMAPEQARGEHVDQRADVFAIGAMLWELCALRRILPISAHQRRRLLRRARIDQDLAAIINKALDPDPDCRYPDEGALAADLKAFKSGARIAARHYTLVAMLAHWIRRHRAFALSTIAVLAIAVVGVVLFIRDIAIERDRVAAANNDLTLEHAELLLRTDPTAAVAALADYRGNDEVRRRRLLAEARGRGVAKAVYSPHSDTIWFLVEAKAGGIVSVAEDRRIQLTRGNVSTTLATDVSTSVRVAYAPSRHLLAYATSPAGIALLDLETMATRRISSLDPQVMEFAPDGSRLAALDSQGALVVWAIASDVTQIYRATPAGATSVRFATPGRLIVQERTGLHALALDATGGAADRHVASEVTAFDARTDAVVAGTDSGSVVMLSSNLAVLGSTPVCRMRLRTVRFIPRSDRITFACQDRVAGVARFDSAKGSFVDIDTFETRGIARVRPEFSGRYIAVGDESNTAYIYDTETRLLTHYDGNAGQPSYVTPDPELGRVLVGDVNGTVRVWDAPTRAAHVVLQAPDAIFRLAFTPDGKSLVTGGTERLVRLTELSDGSTRELQRHGATILGLQVSRDGGSILSYGYDGTARVWRVGDSALARRFGDHASVVEGADFIEHDRRVVSAGDDGRLLAWSPGGDDVKVLFKHGSPLTGLELLRRSGHVVIKDAEGSVWDVAPDGDVRKVRDADGANVTIVRASGDGRYLATGSDAGVVVVYETSSWSVITTVAAEGSIRQIQFDPLDRDLVIASEAGRTLLGHVQIVALGPQRVVRWHTVAAAVRNVAYAPDGETIGFVCADGGAWLYSMHSDIWAYTRDHNTDTFTARFSPDGRLFATSDRRGLVVVRDVQSTLAGMKN